MRKEKSGLGSRQGADLPIWLFPKKGSIGYKHSLPKANSPNRIVTASRNHQHPQGVMDLPQRFHCLCILSCQTHSGMAVQLPDCNVPDHPRIVGSWDSPHRIPYPWASNQGRLREKCWVLPQCPRSHSTPPSPCKDVIREAPFGASALEDWCQSVDPLRMSISTPRAMQVASSQDPATLCSTISSPQQLDQGPTIRKLSHGG